MHLLSLSPHPHQKSIGVAWIAGYINRGKNALERLFRFFSTWKLLDSSSSPKPFLGWTCKILRLKRSWCWNFPNQFVFGLRIFTRFFERSCFPFLFGISNFEFWIEWEVTFIFEFRINLLNVGRDFGSRFIHFHYILFNYYSLLNNFY